MSSSYQKKDTKNNNDKDVLEVIERDPTGQYVRYDEILGDGSSKRVYKGFDEVNGIEIAWCKIEIPDKILKSNEDLQYLYSEAGLLKTLMHDHIMICYHSWVDHGKKTINMITEFFTSGNLRQYRKKYNLVGSDNKAIKNWGRQILQGLDYLHCHDPPIIHRDLKCDNLFVNGNSGEVKIGDLGLAVILDHGYNTASGFAGTLEFMAPEVFEKEYNQSVDVYSFGLCLLELLTREMPYGECSSPNEVYKRVSSGVKPGSLTKVTDPHVRQLIEKCLGPASDRPSTSELLSDQFFAPGSPISARLVSPISDLVDNSLAVQEGKKFRLEGKMQRNDEIPMTLRIKERGQAHKVDFVYLPRNDTIVSVMEEMGKELGLTDQEVVEVSELMDNLLKEVAPGTPESSVRLASPVTDEVALSQTLTLPIQEEKKIRLEGKMQMDDAISMTLWIEKLGGQADKIQFVYSLQSDTIVSVTEEMGKNLGLSAEEVVRVSELMDNLLAELAPGNPKSLRSASPVTDDIASSHTLQLPVVVKKFRLEGKMQMNDAISMTLWIEKLDGVEKAEFVYSLQSDTIVSVSEEMAKNFGLSAEEMVRVSELMDNLLAKLVPAEVPEGSQATL